MQQRLSIGSPGRKPHLGAGEMAEGKAPKTARPAPDKSIHLIPLLTFLCFLVLFLLSRDPSLPDSPVLAAAAVTARSLEATVDTTAAIGGDGHGRRKEHSMLLRARKMGDGATAAVRGISSC